MKKTKLPYKNCAWRLGLKKKKEQELFFEIDNNACSKVYGKYYDNKEIIIILMALIHHNVQMHMAGAVLDFNNVLRKRKNKKHHGKPEK